MHCAVVLIGRVGLQLELLHDLLHVLDLIFVPDQECVGRVHNDEVFDAHCSHDAALALNEAITAIDGHHFPHEAITRLVRGDEGTQRFPGTHITPTVPISPYGVSKLMTEWILRDVSSAHDLSYAALRYFNVAGADPAGRTGQSTPNATHLIKVASQAVVGRRDEVEIFGEDYDTPDGTCIRDYIHVSDLAASHVDALQCLIDKNENLVLNCGYGHGYSVREILNAVEAEAPNHLNIQGAPRRAGDPPSLVADVARIRNVLDWQPRYDDLHFIVRTAIEWEKKLAAES